MIRTPPYDYEWTLNNGQGSAGIGRPNILYEIADRNYGYMVFNIWNDPIQPSVGSAEAAVGIYFRPDPTINLWGARTSFPLYFNWGTWSYFASAQTYGWIGFTVQAFKLSDNSFDGQVVDQRIQLFNVATFYPPPIGITEDSNSAYPLQAAFTTDSTHYYIIWVHCGGTIWAKGWGAAGSGSSANSNIYVAQIPSISLEQIILL